MKPVSNEEKIAFVKKFSGVKNSLPLVVAIISLRDSVKGFEIARAFAIL